MTRGTAFFVTPWGKDKVEVVKSCEFNGDMYPSGHYEEMIERLNRVEKNADFYKEILEFDKNNHDYQSEKENYFTFYREIREVEAVTLDMTKDYFEDFFSDYIFIRAGKNPVTVKTEEQVVTIKPYTTEAFNFGTWVSPKVYAEQAKRG